MDTADPSVSPQLPEQWKKGELLGQGSFGKVFLLIDLSDRDKKLYVIKELLIPMVESSRDKLMKDIKKETEILLYLEQHDRIVPFYGHHITRTEADLFFGYMPLGSLSGHYNEHGPLSEYKCLVYTVQILEGLKYLHDRRIVHGDIKAANVLLQSDSHLRLADFGLSKLLDATCQTFADGSGTYRWMAPEIVNPAFSDGKYNFKADIWSVGCTMVEMLTGNVPYMDIENDTHVIRNIHSGKPPKLPEQTEKTFHFYWLLNLFFRLDPLERTSTNKLLEEVRHIASRNFSINGECLSNVGKAVAQSGNRFKSFGEHFTIYNDFMNVDVDVDTVSMVDDVCGMHAVNCSAEPGIQSFIPITDFTVDHLPVDDPELYSFILNVADLTVRICAKIISDKRPYNYPYKYRFSSVGTRSGTGIVYRLHHYTEDIRHRSYMVCPCVKCQRSQAPSTSWAEIEVITSAHVLFDDVELLGATCRFFFNGPREPGITMTPFRSIDMDSKFDTHIFTCVTCDKDLVQRLDETVDMFDSQRVRMHEKYRKFRDTYRNMFMVSHPHGWPKQISIGKWVKLTKKDDIHSKFTYRAPSCPGSSGAYVHVLGYSGKVWHYPHLHKGDSETGAKESCCGFLVE